jgi:hypothetical protein
MKSKTLLQPSITTLSLKPRQSHKLPCCKYGACGPSGCKCPAYEGSGNTCVNCGHSYDSHW